MSQLDASVAKRLDITVKQNQTFDGVITFTDNANAPIDLTGAQVKMSVRQGACGCGSSFECAGDSNFNQVFKQDFTPQIGGTGHNVLTFNEVVQLAEGNYKYDLLVEYLSGKQQYVLAGNFRVKRSYTSI